ncbi:MAG: cytochrome c, partial [Planctomycetaceae bacterium]
VFDELWKTWPEPLRSRAETATAAERRRMAFSRYGLMEDPASPGTGTALGYVNDGRGGWVMNCMACHSGKVAGQVIVGLPNSHYALQTLTEEVRATKLRMGKKLAHMDLANFKLPLATTNGTTNAVIFGIVLGALRDADMNVIDGESGPLMHHDMDAPPWWHYRKRSTLYIDGFSPKNHRVLMQFMLLPSNDRQDVLAMQDDFRAIEAFIESVEPPRYPWAIDNPLAEKGRTVFEKNCAECHGTYGEHPTYPERMVPIDVIGTDPVRLHALTPQARQKVKESWMSYYGEQEVVTEPEGYVAPPLDGVWATAPYLHNGSVPTLWHLLRPDDRPTVWRRSEDGYDRRRMGLEVEMFDRVPSGVKTPAERRWYFDTRRPGKSAGGHRFPDVLTEDEKRAVLEYLKTL